MNKENNPFDNLLKIGQLKREAFIQAEFDGLVSTANRKLHDSKNASLSKDSRFDLAYNAAHSLEDRYTVFQLLDSTAGLPASIWRIFAAAHQKRNLAEYEGFTEIESSLLEALINATEKLNLILRNTN